MLNSLVNSLRLFERTIFATFCTFSSVFQVNGRTLLVFYQLISGFNSLIPLVNSFQSYSIIAIHQFQHFMILESHVRPLIAQALENRSDIGFNLLREENRFPIDGLEEEQPLSDP